MEPFHYEDLRALGTALPCDIESRKQFGDFEGALRLTEQWLRRDIPENLRARLHVEREILRVLPLEYPLAYEEAYEKVHALLPDLTPERFRQLQDEGRIDWIYVNGKEHFISSAAGTIRNDLEKARRREEGIVRGSEFEENSPLQDVIRRMQENGEDAFRFKIIYALRIRDEAFRPGPVKVYLPVVCGCDYVSDIELLHTSSGSFYLSPEDAPIRTICFEEDMEENHEFSVTFSFTSKSRYHDLWSAEALEANRRAEGITISGKKPGANTAEGTLISEERPGTCGEETEGSPPPDQRSERFDPVFPAGDLSESLPHLVFTRFLKDLAAEITAGLETPLEKARAIYDYITSEVTYSYVRSYCTIENLGEYALLNQRGDCGLQALSFIALCRICGIPARWQSGNECCDGAVSCHDWAMVYLRPWGWLYCDPSYGGSAYRCGAPIRRRHYFGNLDPYRIPSCREFQVQLDPPMTYFRADPYDNQSGEVEYEDRSLAENEFTTRKTLLSAEHLSQGKQIK